MCQKWVMLSPISTISGSTAAWHERMLAWRANQSYESCSSRAAGTTALFAMMSRYPR